VQAGGLPSVALNAQALKQDGFWLADNWFLLFNSWKKNFIEVYLYCYSYCPWCEWAYKCQCTSSWSSWSPCPGLFCHPHVHYPLHNCS